MTKKEIRFTKKKEEPTPRVELKKSWQARILKIINLNKYGKKQTG